MPASLRTRGRVLAAGAAFYVAGVSLALLTNVPSAMSASIVLVAAAAWSFGYRAGLAALGLELAVGFALFATGSIAANAPAAVVLIPVAATDSVIVLAFAALRASARRRAATEAELRQKNAELAAALAEVKELRGMLPICAWCKCVRDVNGIWNKLESYLARHSHATLTHGICPTCVAGLAEEVPSLPPTG